MNVLDVTELHKRFPVGASRGSLMDRLRARTRHRSWLHAVDDVSFSIGPGESVGLVGESGCGKSTLVRLITRVLDVTSGDIVFHGRNIGFLPARSFSSSAYRAKIQMVFQDPSDSLNPRFTAFDAIAEPLRRLASASAIADCRARVTQAALDVGLPPELLGRYPHQLSGGQKARIGIARAIVLRPELLILDEPTAALDVSVQATILKLLSELRAKLGMSYLFVSHDLNVVRMLCDRVLVMYLGRIVEQGPTEPIFRRPAHPYTRALIRAIPVIGACPDAGTALKGEPRSPIDPAPRVCRFVGRCPREEELCSQQAPALREIGDGRLVACHLASRS